MFHCDPVKWIEQIAGAKPERIANAYDLGDKATNREIHKQLTELAHAAVDQCEFVSRNGQPGEYLRVKQTVYFDDKEQVWKPHPAAVLAQRIMSSLHAKHDRVCPFDYKCLPDDDIYLAGWQALNIITCWDFDDSDLLDTDHLRSELSDYETEYVDSNIPAYMSELKDWLRERSYADTYVEDAMEEMGSKESLFTILSVAYSLFLTDIYQRVKALLMAYWQMDVLTLINNVPKDAKNVNLGELDASVHFDGDVLIFSRVAMSQSHTGVFL